MARVKLHRMSPATYSALVSDKPAQMVEARNKIEEISSHFFLRLNITLCLKITDGCLRHISETREIIYKVDWLYLPLNLK